MGGVMSGESLASLVWCLTRLQLQCEAVIEALEKKEPGFRNLVAEEMKELREQGRILQIAAETKHEIDQVSDWSWLKSHGIDPNSPKV
jgi:hypothetical protein